GDGAADEVQYAEIGQDVRRGELRPRSARRLGRSPPYAEQEPCFFERLADGGERERARFGRARALELLHQVRLYVRIELARRRHAPVGRIDAAAGKDEFSRHEFVAVMALAEQDLGDAPGSVH